MQQESAGADGQKQRIRDAAVRCFVERGFAETRLIDIAKAAGLSKGGIYFHYRAKEELFIDIQEQILGTLRQRVLMHGLDPSVPPKLALQRLIVRSVGDLEARPMERQLLNLLFSLADRDDQVRVRLRDALVPLIDQLQAVLRAGLARGDFEHCDETEVAQFLIGEILGLGRLAALELHGRSPLCPERVAEMCIAAVENRSATGGQYAAMGTAPRAATLSTAEATFETAGPGPIPGRHPSNRT